MKDAEQPAIITGSTASVKTMADDTLRVTIDIEPRHAQRAFAMFGTRGTPVAIARLTAEAAVAQTRREDAPDFGKHYELLYKRGWWHNPRVSKRFAPNATSVDDRIGDAKAHIYQAFGVESLAEIDPKDFYDWLALPDYRLADTLPREFLGAA